MLSQSAVLGNQLLDRLPQKVVGHLAAHMETAVLGAWTTLQVPGLIVRHAYFPLDCTISLLNMTKDGHSTEVAAIGNEGMLGGSIVLGGKLAVNQAIVTMGGRALQLDTALLEAELARDDEARLIMLQYVQWLLTLDAQNTACLTHHGIEQRLARWLLHASDRALSSTLLVTHDAIANALGVRREGITIAVNKLHQLGLVDNRRARIQLLDHERLLAAACECYGAVQAEYHRLLPAR